MSKTEKLSNEEILGLKVDVLVPAALENVITKGNASKVSAKVILELANGPIDNDGDAVLNEKGIAVVPDILANSGGVTVSYFEWVQNRQGYYWSVHEVSETLKVSMEKASLAIYEISKNNRIPLRTAAYVSALKRIDEAVKAKGTGAQFRK
jgi:glutamate dehydrogenase (NADP+)